MGINMSKYNNLFCYAGSKISMLKHIIKDEIIPKKGKILIEPFAGSCAFILNTEYDTYYINDNNVYITNFIKAIMNEDLDLIEKEYYLIRDKVKSLGKENWCKNYRDYRDEFLNNYDNYNLIQKASGFLFLINFSFGGKPLNKQITTGNGKFTRDYIFRKDIYKKFKQKNIKIYNLNYKEFIKEVLKEEKQEDCVLYLDPPYINSFKYNKDNILDNYPLEIKEYFSIFDKIVMSNFKNDDILNLYKDYNIKEITRRIEMNSKNKQDKIELIIWQ